MNPSKERKELLVKLSSEVYDFISETWEKNGLYNGEVIDICINVTTSVISMILSESTHNLDDVIEQLAELHAGNLSRGIVRGYYCFVEMKKHDAERDNTSKDPA